MSTDDLLDRALGLADALDHLGAGSPEEAAPEDIGEAADALRALVERVQQAEAERQEWADLWQQASMSVLRLTDERDAARGKLDKVRQWSDNNLGGAQNAALLAILDGKTRD